MMVQYLWYSRLFLFVRTVDLKTCYATDVASTMEYRGAEYQLYISQGGKNR